MILTINYRIGSHISDSIHKDTGNLKNEFIAACKHIIGREFKQFALITKVDVESKNITGIVNITIHYVDSENKRYKKKIVTSISEIIRYKIEGKLLSSPELKCILNPIYDLVECIENSNIVAEKIVVYSNSNVINVYCIRKG